MVKVRHAAATGKYAPGPRHRLRVKGDLCPKTEEMKPFWGGADGLFGVGFGSHDRYNRCRGTDWRVGGGKLYSYVHRFEFTGL